MLAAVPGLPFTETFDDATLSDAAQTTADWGVTTPGKLTLPSAPALTDAFSSASAGEPLGGEAQITRGLAFGDMNGDGFIDIVEGDAGVNGVYLNDGAGNFTTRTALTGTTANTRAIAVGDVDGDGDLDIVAGILNSAPLRLYLNSGDGVTYTVSDIGNLKVPTDSIALADFNGDGHLDVVTGNHNQFRNYLYLNSGNPQAPFSPTDSGLRITNAGNDTQSILAGDLDNDGDIDLVEMNQNQRNAYYLNDGKGNFVGHGLGADPDNSQSGALGDFNGDGFLDVFVGNFGSAVGEAGQCKVYLNSGDPTDPFGNVTPIPVIGPDDPPSVHGAIVADIDNDGDLDIIVATAMPTDNSATRFTNRILLNDGTGKSWTEVELGSETQVTNTVIAGDVDGDGKLDIVAGNEGRDIADNTFPVADTLFRNAGQASATTARQLRAKARSLRVDTSTANIASVSLGIDPAVLGAHNAADFWVSSDAGAHWLHVLPNVAPVAFPQAISAQDLRWRVDLRSLSPSADVGAGALAIDTLTLNADSPMFTSAPVTAATSAAAYSYSITASDPNGDPLTFSAARVPAWLSLTDNGGGKATLAGTPAEADVGKVQVEIDVSDGTHTTKQTFVVTVESGNGTPTFTSTAPTSAAVGASYQYAIAATDPNAGDTLTLSAPTLPAWLLLTDNGDGTGTLTGTPGPGDVGDAAVQLQVEDQGGATATQDFKISVAAGNAPPSFTSTPTTDATADELYTYGVTTSDPNTGDTVTITAAAALPAWLALTDRGDGTATLTGTPTATDVGDVTVKLQVADQTGAAGEPQVFVIHVAAPAATNNPPSFTSMAVTTATAGTAYSYAITTADPDAGDTRTITSTGTLPAWLTLTDHGDGTASLSGTPAATDAGNVDVALQVADAAGATAQQSFTIAVAAGGGGGTTPPPSSGGGGGGGGGGSSGFAELALLLLAGGLKGRFGLRFLRAVLGGRGAGSRRSG
ncbi:MAG TPA: FG-GAP-like repeat-containing protein [Gammaproteobacteria bacterium]|nr:FG-GAP-like repeat-containing protein [Gammaproteobacteria bacterium]